MDPYGAVGSQTQHLGSIRESKPSGAVDPSEPQQPLPALTKLYSMEKQVGTMFSECLSFPLTFLNFF